MRVDPSSPRGASSGIVPPPPFSIGVDVAETSSTAATNADFPPSTTSDDSDIRRMLDHVLTVQAVQRQILVDVLDEILGLQADLAWFRRSSPPPPRKKESVDSKLAHGRVSKFYWWVAIRSQAWGLVSLIV